MKKVHQGIVDFYREILDQQISGAFTPDLNAIGRDLNGDQLCILLQLILGCAINCDKKEDFIQVIMSLEEDVQHVVMKAIQGLEFVKDTSLAVQPETQSELRKALENLEASNQAKDVLSQRCHNFETQLNFLREEKLCLQNENEKLIEKLRAVGCTDSLNVNFEDINLRDKAVHQMQQKIESLQNELFKQEGIKDEYRAKIDILDEEITKLRMKTEELQSKANEAKALKDELDILRHMSEKAEKYETTIELYKKKIEDLNDLRRQNKLNEEKCSSQMKRILELEEELKRNSAYKTQTEVYKKQIQELHFKKSEESHRADKAEYELKRLYEKFDFLTQEKERLILERNALKSQFQQAPISSLSSIADEIASTTKDTLTLSQTPCLKNEISENISDAINNENLKEKLIRLEHENQMLRNNQAGNFDQQIKVLESQLEDEKLRIEKLESENWLANQKILELESRVKDAEETSDYSRPTANNHYLRDDFKQKDRLKSELHEAEQTIAHLQNTIAKKDDELAEMEARYKKYVDKAKSAVRSLDQSLASIPNSPASSVMSSLDELNNLKLQLQQREKYLAGTFFKLKFTSTKKLNLLLICRIRKRLRKGKKYARNGRKIDDCCIS